jgi:hypothetical protein
MSKACFDIMTIVVFTATVTRLLLKSGQENLVSLGKGMILQEPDVIGQFLPT